MPGLLSVIRSGRVALANALGTGVADDKAMYCYVPRMIEFYLGEHAILNNVHTYMLRDPKQRQHVFENLHNLVVKEVQGSGGYGMLIGPASTAEEREAYKRRVMRNPDNYIAQPTLALSTAPTLIEGEIVPRHVDLRPFVLSGKETSVISGGPHARRAAQRLARGQFEPGRRHQGHLGAGALTMLSRTAENLFWMARDMERAENTARMLDVSFRMALLPSTIDKQALHFEPILAIAPGDGRFHELYGELTHETIIRYVALDPANPASIWSLIKLARENARAQRSAISSEAWESLNSTWLQVQNLDFAGLTRWGYRDFFDWVKERSHLFRGVVFGTMLHDDAFRFIRLGTFIERADNTARILDVKYHVLLPETEQVGGYVDYYQWGALLRSVGAFRAYRRVYHDTVYPWRIAELLILRADMPRSLHHCYEVVIGTLDELAGKKQLECRRLAGQIYARLRYGRIDKIFQSGLHEFLIDFIASNSALGVQLQDDFLMTPTIIAGAA